MKKYDVVALGELLIDFTKSEKGLQGNDSFECNPGGAPCNVLAMLTKMGKKTAFIGKVGADMFGHMLIATLKTLGITAYGTVLDHNVNTTLAFVKTDDTGDRSFSFYRNPGADMMLKKSDIDERIIADAKIFHFGTLSMTHKEVREATKYAVSVAKSSGAIISFDPNLRENLWDKLSDAREQMLWGCQNCDILKIEDNELKFLFNSDNYDEANAIKALFSYGIKLIFVTRGANGSTAYYNNISVSQKAFINPDTIDTTGAGDTFCGCCLSFICDRGLDQLTETDLIEMLQFATASASIITTRKGAILAMPQKQEVMSFLQNL